MIGATLMHLLVSVSNFHPSACYQRLKEDSKVPLSLCTTGSGLMRMLIGVLASPT